MGHRWVLAVARNGCANRAFVPSRKTGRPQKGHGPAVGYAVLPGRSGTLAQLASHVPVNELPVLFSAEVLSSSVPPLDSMSSWLLVKPL